MLAPIALKPRPESRVWGGRGLEKLGRALPAGPVGESWEVHGELVVVGGDWAGRTLDELVRELGPALLGPGCESDSFPLLAKWLDCHDWLSVQVHPDDHLARELSGDPRQRGKTECWFVRSAEPEARLVHGLAAGTRPEDLTCDRSLVDLLDYRPARAGDVFLTPAGTVHALGPGLLLYEIQQSSDLTYRLYDWERPGLDGLPRPLHWTQALEVLRRVPPYLAPPIPEGTVGAVRVNTPFFVVEELTGERAWTPERFEILTAFEGEAELESRAGSERVADGEARVLPATVGRIKVRGGRLLRTFVPREAPARP